MIIVLHSQLTECMIIMMVLRFLGDAWCSGIVEEWVKRIEHDKNNDVDYIIDTYMFGVIENDPKCRGYNIKRQLHPWCLHTK